MPKTISKKRSSRIKPNFAEQAMGVQGRGQELARIADFFANPAARTGLGTSSLENGSQYTIERFSLFFWQIVSLFEVSWCARRIVVSPAEDMLKTWPRIMGDTDPNGLAKIDAAIRRTGTKNKVLEALTLGRLYGGAGGLIAIRGHEKKLDEPLDLDEVEIGSYAGVIPFDRWCGITPSSEICTDISKPIDFGLPEYYECHGKEGPTFKVHCSRIMRFCGPMMPEPERSAYSGWGISVIAPVFQTLLSYDNVNTNALALSYRAQLIGLKMPQLASLLSGLSSNQQAAQKFSERMSALNETMSNQSLVLLEADGEMTAAQYSFGGLAELVQMFQLALAGAAKMPVSLLWGRTLGGLGTTGEGDEKIYAKTIATEVDVNLRPQLEKLLPVVAASELGEAPKDMDLYFPSLRDLDEKEKAELAKTTVDSVTVCINTGIMSPRVGAQEIKQASDVTGFGTNLTDEAIEKLSDDVQAEGELGEGLFGEEGGKTLDPSGSPTAALKETDKLKAGKGSPEAPGGRGGAAEGPQGTPEEDDEHDENGLLHDPDEIRPVAKAKDARMTPELVWLEACDNEADTIPKAIRGTEEGQRQVRTNALRNLSFYAEQFKVPYEKCLAYVKGRGLAWDVAQAKDEDGPSRGDLTVHGLPLTIETRKGEMRSNKYGPLPYHYGYICGVKGADGDSMDFALGPEPESTWAYVFDQNHMGTKNFDEHKVFLGYPSLDAAQKAFAAGHDKAHLVYRDVTPMQIDDLKTWLRKGNHAKPVGAAK